MPTPVQNNVHTADTLPLSPGPARAAAASAGEPARIGRYQVLERLGAGGMGVVFAAWDPELERKVAIKLIYADDAPERAQRRQDMLLREAQALARLAHPNIVAIHDVGVHDGQVFVAMEFVAGRTMRAWWQEQRPRWQEVLAAMVQAGRGLVAAHAAGLVHRDIKPDNLLIGDDGRVRVADFGLARIDPSALEPSTLASGVREYATIAGPSAIVGTPMYMPPEQYDGEEIGPFSDQFSFCVTLWEGLFGRRPFVGAPQEIPALVLSGPPTRPAATPEVPGWLERTLQRGLAARPVDRWPSMQALLEALEFDSEARRARRRGRVLTGLLLAVGCVALALGGRTLLADRARRAAEQAATERLAGLGTSVARLLTEGRRGEAEALVRTFAQDPALRDMPAAIDAWLMWADHMDALGDRAAAQAAVVEAYTALPADDPREPGIALRIARQFRAGWRFHELAALGEQVARRWPEQARAPEWAALRVDAALARGDLGGFLAEVDAGAAGEREAVAPALRALATARCPIRGDMMALMTDWPGSPGPELVFSDRHRRRGQESMRRMDAALTPIGPDLRGRIRWPEAAQDRPLVRAPGGPAYLFDSDGEMNGEITLLELGDGPPRALLRWTDDPPASTAAADLDGDGLRELYLGTGTYSRRFYRLEPDAQGEWTRRPAHPPTDALHSDINALVAGDFDGDGREELAAAVGAWRAYDVRIFEAGPDGELRVAARRRFGHVHQMAALRGADGSTLLALAKDDTAPSKEAWPADRPQGEAAGLHVVRRRGDSLASVAYFPWPMIDARPPESRRIVVGDFDGDGLDDVAAQVEVYGSPFARTVLLRQRPDGSFASAILGAITPMLAGDFDGDPADELLAAIQRGDTVEQCVLGVAGETVAPSPAPHAAAETPALADPLLASAWARAEHLAGFGLFTEAARALENRVTLAEGAADRRALLRRSAELFEAAGEFVRAGERFEGLARDGDHAAALRAVANYEQGIEMAGALRVARAALRSEGLTAVQTSELRAAEGRLRAVVEREARIELRFDGPLDPAWTITEPLALRVDPVRHALTIDASADMATVASLPIELTGEPLTIELELEVERADWGTLIGVEIRPAGGGEVVARLGVGSGGGGGYLRRNGRFDPPPLPFGWRDTEGPAVHSVHRLRALLLPEHGRVHVEELGDRPDTRTEVWHQPLRPGRYSLAIVSTGIADFATQRCRARIRRIAVFGARQAPAGVDAGSRVAGDLVEARWHAVLTDGEATTELGRLWRGVAQAELGRTIEAIAAFASLDPTAPEIRRQLRHLLRTRLSTFALLLRAAYGPRYAGLLLEALRTKGEYPDAELWALRLAATADLEGLPSAGEEDARTLAELRVLRGLARRSVGELAGAEDDLAAAAATIERQLAETGASREASLATIELRRAEIAASRGRVDEAFAAAERALRGATEPEWMAERLRISRELERLHADPRWAALTP